MLLFSFGNPIYRVKVITYVTRTTGYFGLSTFAVLPHVTLIHLAGTLAFGRLAMAAPDAAPIRHEVYL